MTRLLLIGVLLVCTSCYAPSPAHRGYAQDVTVVGQSPVVTLAASSEVSHAKTTLRMVRKAIADSDLSLGQKILARIALRRKSVQDRVTDFVTSQAIDDGVIVMPAMVDGQMVEAAIDWDALLEFIEKLIPLIMQLIALFG